MSYTIAFKDHPRDDESSLALVEENYRELVADPDVNFLVGPYSSKLSIRAADVAREANHTIIHGGASSGTLHTYGYYNFMTYAESALYWVDVLDELQKKNIASVCVISIDTAFPRAAAVGAVAYAKEKGITVNDEVIYHEHGMRNDIAEKLIMCRDGGYDAVFACSNKPADADLYAEVMEGLHYHPKALGITVQGASPDFVRRKGDATLGVLGPTQWTEHVPHDSSDAVFGTALQYAELYYAKYDDNRDPPTYPCAGASASILAYKFAIESLTTTDPVTQLDVAQALHSLDVPSFWGHMKWGEDGSIDKPVYTTQIQVNSGEEGIFPIIAPFEARSEHETDGTRFDLIYPRLQYTIGAATCPETPCTTSCPEASTANNDDDDSNDTMTVLLIVIVILFVLQTCFLAAVVYYEFTMRPMFMFGEVVSKGEAGSGKRNAQTVE